MSGREEGSMTQGTSDDPPPLESAAADLDAAEAAADEDRARLLEELYETLESELDRDVDHAGPPRH
jgi:hypothetical protein